MIPWVKASPCLLDTLVQEEPAPMRRKDHGNIFTGTFALSYLSQLLASIWGRGEPTRKAAKEALVIQLRPSRFGVSRTKPISAV